MGIRNGIYDTFVPYEGSPTSKLWIVGESPGEDEEIHGRPFIGQSGQILRDTLRRHGISESDCYFANLSHYRPLGNTFERLLSSDQLREGKAELLKLHTQHSPNLVLALGAWPLNFFSGKCESGKGITKWRGSILPIQFGNGKVLGTFHPANIARDESNYPMFDFDIARAAKEKEYEDIRHRVKREFVIDPRGLDLHRWMEVLSASDRLAVDIESIKKSTTILCVGFAPSPELSVVIPFKDGERIAAINTILQSPSKKIFHFGTFDIEMHRLNGINIENYWWDTIIAQHILNPELPRGLDFLTSVYTDEPYYKEEGRGEIPDDAKVWSANTDPNKLYIYNAKDCAFTAEIQLEQEKELKGRNLELFHYEMELQGAAFEIMQNGLPIDLNRRSLIERAAVVRWGKLQATLDLWADDEINVNSPVKVKNLLYKKLDLPVQRKKDNSITADEDAIVHLITICKNKIEEYKTEKKKQEWMKKLIILKLILQIRGIRKMISSYVLFALRDGKAHSTVSVMATETGRWAMSKYVDGTGLNAQTMPRDPFDVPDDIMQADANKMANMLETLSEEVEEKDEALP